MERQKPKVIQSIDGFNRNVPRAHLYSDRFSGSTISRSNPQQTNSSSNALPSLRPRPLPNGNNVLKAQQSDMAGINRTVSATTLQSIDGTSRQNNQTLSRTLLPQTIVSGTTHISQRVDSLQAYNQNWSTNQEPKRSFNPVKIKSKPKKIFKLTALAILIMVLGFGGWFASSLLGNVNKVFHGNVFTDAHALIGGAPLKESNGRVNILLAGDQGAVSDEGPLTDSIMVISINAKTKTGFILSIPRDLWVYIPSLGHQKINAASDVTSFSKPGLPSGGMGQLQQIVQSDLGIPIDYEALIDYSAFKDAVNAVGGISIDIQSPDPRGLYDPYANIKLPNGQASLNGTQALNLARARGDGYGSYGFPGSDFSRTMYQRIMLKGLFVKALSAGVLANPIKITNLFSSFGNNVQTNLSLGAVISLTHLAQGLNLSNLKSTTYSFGGSNGLLTNYTSPKNGQESLIPTLGLNNFSQLRAYYNQLSSSDPVIQEAPTVTLLNGSDVSGLASKEKQILETQGFNVVSIADASTVYPSSMIVNNSNAQKPAAESLLQKDIPASVVTSSNGSPEAKESASYNSNFVVIMGQNWDKTGSNGNLIQ